MQGYRFPHIMGVSLSLKISIIFLIINGGCNINRGINKLGSQVYVFKGLLENTSMDPDCIPGDF